MHAIFGFAPAPPPVNNDHSLIKRDGCIYQKKDGPLIKRDGCIYQKKDGHLIKRDECTYQKKDGHLIKRDGCIYQKKDGHIIKKNGCTYQKKNGCTCRIHSSIGVTPISEDMIDIKPAKSNSTKSVSYQKKHRCDHESFFRYDNDQGLLELFCTTWLIW